MLNKYIIHIITYNSEQGVHFIQKGNCRTNSTKNVFWKENTLMK